MRSRWKRIRYRLEWLGLLLAAKLIPLLSRRACRYLARIAAATMVVFDRHRFDVALNNLEVAFGNELSPRERRRIARQSFQHFARTMVDLFWSSRLTRENFSRYIEWQNFEETGRSTDPDRSVIIACYHYSNFEWLSLACGFLDLKGTIIAQEFKNSLLDPIFKTAGMTHQQIAQACWNSFEPYVRKDPAPWLWMYKHWRYRPVKTDRPYPFYANPMWRFDEMVQRDRVNPIGGTGPESGRRD